MPNPKEVAGARAAELVRDGMVVGLGTGSTVHFALLRLAERMRAEGLRIRGVPTSIDTERKAGELGIPLAGLESVERIDLTIDGADEIDGQFRMIKGGGAALLREKVVASLTDCEVIVVGPDKLVAVLGRAFPLPVEVVPFARPVVERVLRRLGGEPVLRRASGGDPLQTDNGNQILDSRFPSGIRDPAALERVLALTPGVVESGLFIDLAHVLVIGHPDGRAEVRQRPS
jgi:ribose 5-phosphate isomerase A